MRLWDVASGEVHAHQDCQAVVRELSQPLAHQLRHSHVHAGQVRATLGRPGLVSVRTVSKVKAHTTEQQIRALVEALRG